jgi:hypothetical protein
MYLKLIPFILILAGAIGGYVFVTDLQADNQLLVSDKATLISEKADLSLKVDNVEKVQRDQETEIDRLIHKFEQDQQEARRLAEASAKSNHQLQQRLSDLTRTAKNDTQDTCSFSPMPEHIIRLLNSTDTTAQDSGNNQHGNEESNATSTFNSEKPNTSANRYKLD